MKLIRINHVQESLSLAELQSTFIEIRISFLSNAAQKPVTGTHLKNRILVQDRGGAELSQHGWIQHRFYHI